MPTFADASPGKKREQLFSNAKNIFISANGRILDASRESEGPASDRARRGDGTSKPQPSRAEAVSQLVGVRRCPFRGK